MSNETVTTSLKEKIDDLNQQAWEARITDSPKAFELSNESVKLSRDINYSKGLAEGLRSLGFCYVRLFKNDEAEPLLRESLSLFQSLNDLRGQAVIYEYLGIIERNWGNLGRSLELLLKGNELIQQVGPVEIETTTAYQIGVTYKHLGNHENALDYLYRSLALAEKIDLTLMVAYSTNIIGSIYFDNGNYEKALELYQQGLVIRRQSNDKWGEAGSLDNIGITYLKLNELDKAIDYCKQSLAISQSTGDKKGEANALLHLAEIYEQANDIQQASKFSNESLAIRKARGDKRGEAEVLLFLAELHKNRNDVDDQQVYEWLSAALNIANEIKAQDILSKAFFNLHEYYQEKGDYKRSLAQLESHLHIEKELHKNAINQKVSNLEISHKAEAISQQNKELTELNKQIEKANAELKVEASLERVRAVTMSMGKPDEVLNICKIMFAELQLLGFKDVRNAMINFWDDDHGLLLDYDYSDFSGGNFAKLFYSSHPVFETFQKKVRAASDAFAELVVNQDELETWKQRRRDSGEYEDPRLDNISALYYYFYSTGVGALGISTFTPISKENLEILKRFRNVFDLTYRRYLDIVKAEAQAREAQIEAALERIRARAMAMHSSDEIMEVANILREQMGLLNQPDLETSVVNLLEEDPENVHSWHAFRQPGTSGTVISGTLSFPKNSSELGREMLALYDNGVKEFTIEASGQRLKEFNQVLISAEPNIAKYIGDHLPEKVYYHFAAFKGGTLLTVSYQPPTDDVKSLQRRAASVFDMAYRRYLDLKNAEAQAREAQIEAALERVRSRMMAMHKSEELLEVIKVVFDQLCQLSFNIDTASFVINSNEDEYEFWVAYPGQIMPVHIKVPFINNPILTRGIDALKKEIDFFSDIISKEEKNNWLLHIFKHSDLHWSSDERKDFILKSNGMARSIAIIKQIALVINNYAVVPYTNEENSILKRFANVFEQSYTRFLDLQKAEAQARESLIQLALERARAQSMIMQHSTELDDTLRVFHEQVLQLGIPSAFSFLWLPDEEKGRHIFWAAWAEDNSKIFKSKAINYPLDRNEPATSQCLVDWKSNQPVVSYHVPPEGVENYFAAWSELIAGVEQLKPEYFSDGLYYVEAFIKYGCFGVMVKNELSEDEKKILNRFAIEFERTYTRFLDLQKAEAQTREALIEGALERVRARALAMQQPEELKDVAQVLRNEMGALGIEELETCSIYIHEKGSETAECWYALKDPNDADKKMVADHFHLELDDTWVGREMKKFYSSDEKQTSIVMQGDNRKEWINYCYKHSPVFSGFYGDTIPDRTYHLYKFSHGYIGAAAPGDISAESWRLLSRAASVFSLAYSRFRDLTQARNDLIKLKEEKKRAEDALTELQNAQKQLIQTEKMASLGELTAGIAHEIQNPLNFVNNFSDVTTELIEEMKEELSTGNQQLATELAENIKENLEKILHHGKRADAIVKGMLQHSRSSSGVKEPTDINNLADEYLRLAFHGYRAKDKSFNAKFETYFDNSIEQINVIPQDIGRVILNLINNAFYTVNEKRKKVSNGYEPMVIVSTKKVNDKVEISVKDNGNGIPQKMLDKIFQPFFTTKPTGQGTGLGLSLSYDIITKGHAGEIEVKTEDGKGAEFIVSLPVN